MVSILALAIVLTAPHATAQIEIVDSITVNFSTFQGSGFTPTPAAGQLNSDDWAITGFSTGDLAFGGTATSGDYARGASAGGESLGGIYAFDVGGSSNNALGVQASSTDFTPGTITLRIRNVSGATLDQIHVAYEVHEYNDGDGSTSVTFSHSDDDLAYTAVPSLDTTTTGATGVAGWSGAAPKSTTISSANVPDLGFFYLR